MPDVDGRKGSVSIATFEFKPSGSGTKLILTEQSAFLDGYDDNGSRERRQPRAHGQARGLSEALSDGCSVAISCAPICRAVATPWASPRQGR